MARVTFKFGYVLVTFMVIDQVICGYYECRQGPCVTTPMGTVLGRQFESILANGDLKRVNGYLGIPFAKPPTQKLRFADPQPMPSWPGLLRATSYGKSCFGMIFTPKIFKNEEMWNPPGREAALSEDCLYLNIWAPPGQQNRPVMVWIYGGSFVSGSSSLWAYNGQFLAAAENMVVVSFNYRLGALGFMKTRDGTISGNFGLKDQQEALRWVHKNVHYFGGNNSTITIVGMSAGAASVGYHLLSEKSWGFFENAVMNSGSPYAPWAYKTPDETHNQSDELLKKLHCSTGDTLRCLRSLSPWAIYEKDKFDKWAPTIDGKVLTDSPKDLVSKGKHKKAPLMITLNRDEGSVIAYERLGDRFTRNGLLKPITLERFRSNMDAVYPTIPEAERDTAVEMYTQGIKSNGTALSLAVSEIIGDSRFVCPVMRWAADMSSNNLNVYLLKLNYRASTESYPEWMGVVHGADYQWTFGIPLDRDRNYQQREIALAEKYMKYLANFIRNGDPNGSRLQKWYPSPRRSICFQNDTSIVQCVIGEESRDRCGRWDAIFGLSSSERNVADITLCSLLSILTLMVTFLYRQ